MASSETDKSSGKLSPARFSLPVFRHLRHNTGAAHVSRFAQSFRWRPRRARSLTGLGAPRRRGRRAANLFARRSRTRIRSLAPAWRELRGDRRGRLSAPAANDRRPAAARRGARSCRRAGDAAGRHGRLAQCLGRRRQIDSAHRARAHRGGICHRFRPRARHRRRRPPRQSFNRNGRGAGRRSRSRLSARTRRFARRHSGRGRRAQRNAARLGAARARFPAPQSAHFRAGARRRHRRSRQALRLADHRAAGARNKAAKCSRCPARRSIRAPKAPTA